MSNLILSVILSLGAVEMPAAVPGWPDGESGPVEMQEYSIKVGKHAWRTAHRCSVSRTYEQFWWDGETFWFFKVQPCHEEFEGLGGFERLMRLMR